MSSLGSPSFSQPELVVGVSDERSLNHDRTASGGSKSRVASGSGRSASGSGSGSARLLSGSKAGGGGGGEGAPMQRERKVSFRNPGAHLTREEVIRSASTMKQLKPISPSRCRWNVPWLILCWVVISLPLWMPFAASCKVSYYVTASVALWFDLLWFLAIFFTIRYMIKMKRGMNVDYKAKYPADTPLYHLIILTIYKDPMEVIFKTVDSIAQQTEAKRIVMVMAWEQRTPAHEERTRQMRERYDGRFHALIFTVHPFALPHEIASKAANANWGLREAIIAIFRDGIGPEGPATNVNDYMVTTCDSDTLFHERYFEALSADYLQLLKKGDPAVHRTIWQAPLFYNWNLDQNSFIARITGLLRTTMMMGMLIPYNVNPMSCFSFSMDLAIRGGYWHPQIFMDDVGYLLTMMIGAQARVGIRALPVPVLSGPTSGATWASDVWEWYVQVRRWGIGTADDWHYFCVKICRLPFHAAVIFAIGYFLYYGVILCAGSLFGVANIAYPYLCPDVAEDYTQFEFLKYLKIYDFQPSPTQLLIGLALLQYFFYGCMFVLDAIWCKIIIFVKEDISIFRNFAHFILTGPALIALSLVQLWSYHVIAFKGKVGACIHQLAGKATLGAGGGAAPIPGARPQGAGAGAGAEDAKTPLLPTV